MTNSPKLEDLRAFAAVVEAGSLSAAARRMGLAKSVVSKRLADLEAASGVELVRRTTRSAQPSEAGQAFYARAKRILADLDAAIEEAAGETGPLKGPLRVAAPVTFGRLHLAPLLIEFACAHREVDLAVDCDDRMVDLAGGGYDFGVRIGRLADSSLVARRIAPSPRVVVASPDYIAREGQPKTLDELSRHTAIGYSNAPAAHFWQFAPKRKGEQPQSIAMRGRFTVNSGEIGLAAMIAGLGVGVAPLFMCADALKDGRLVRVLPDTPPTEDTIYAVWPGNAQLSRKARTLVDLLVARLPAMLPVSAP